MKKIHFWKQMFTDISIKGPYSGGEYNVLSDKTSSWRGKLQVQRENHFNK